MLCNISGTIKYTEPNDEQNDSLRLFKFLLDKSVINQNISQGSATSDDALAEYDGPSLISWARKFNCLPRLLFKALESGQKIDLLKKEKEKKSLFDEVCELYKAAIDGQGKSKYVPVKLRLF